MEILFHRPCAVQSSKCSVYLMLRMPLEYLQPFLFMNYTLVFKNLPKSWLYSLSREALKLLVFFHLSDWQIFLCHGGLKESSCFFISAPKSKTPRLDNLGDPPPLLFPEVCQWLFMLLLRFPSSKMVRAAGRRALQSGGA